MKNPCKLKTGCCLALLLAIVLATPALAVDLRQHYPTTLIAGDTEPDHARAWEFNPEDVYHVTRFDFKVGDHFKVTMGDADLGVGHCTDGAVWAVLIPRTPGTLTSPITNSAEPISHVWLRFHPGELDFPEAGRQDVAPGETEIKVTFSKDMADQSWSWCTAWSDSNPENLGKPHYDADHRTCILKVKLEPNKTYGWWINRQRFNGFQDPQGHTAVPYLFVFQTKGD